VNGLRAHEKAAKKWLEKKLIGYADSVITVSHSIASEYSALYGIPKPHVMLNCPTYVEQKKTNLFREKLGIRDDQTIFLYQGGLVEGRGIDLMLEAFSDLESDHNVLVCMGYGSLEGVVRAKSICQPTVFFHPAVDPDVLLSYTSSADYGIAFIEDCSLSDRYCLPNKLFEYLMAGLPVLTSNLPEMRRLVESEGVGVVAECNSVTGFKRALIKCQAQNYFELQLQVFAARSKYCWELQEKVLREIVDAL
jgi:glycosyltransferase involved in cell wall biosynthesis